VLERAFHKGLLLLGCGENTVRFMPPLIVTREQAELAVEILDEVLSEIQHPKSRI
jgi:4-aminobutyrate aminotransferase